MSSAAKAVSNGLLSVRMVKHTPAFYSLRCDAGTTIVLDWSGSDLPSALYALAAELIVVAEALESEDRKLTEV